jgi:hypothetical protein
MQLDRVGLVESHMDQRLQAAPQSPEDGNAS